MSYNNDTTSPSEKQVNLVQIAQEVVHDLLLSYNPEPLPPDADGLYHYIYITWNKDTYKFYVGKHSSKNPATDSYIGSGNHLLNAVKKHGASSFEHRILQYTLTAQEAFDLEATIVNEGYIRWYRDELQITYNLIGGGGKGVVSEETRQKQSEAAKKYFDENPEAREKANEILKKYYEETPEAREKHGEYMKQYYEENIEVRQKAIERLKEYWSDPEAREKKSEAMKEYWSDPEAREKKSEAMKKYHEENPEAREKQNEILREYWANSEVRQKQSENRTKYFEDNPEARIKNSEALKKYYENPEAIIKNSEAQKKYHAENPEARQKHSEAVKKYYEENPEERKKVRDRVLQQQHALKELTDLSGVNSIKIHRDEVLQYLKEGWYFNTSRVVLHNPTTLEQLPINMYQKGKDYRATNTPRIIKLLEEGWVLGYAPKN
jgi:hypothetical protein